MLNKSGSRELAYIVKIDEIEPIVGRDRVECAIVGGWKIMVRKGELHPGDYAVYFEIDSKLPECAPFEFLAAKHYKIKTQRYKTPDGPFYSQGLIMPFKDFMDEHGDVPTWLATINLRIANGEDVTHTFLTEALGVTYADPADNTRKAKSMDKYAKMAQRHPKLFKKPWAKWMMRRSWGRKVMFAFFGKKKDKKNGWPEWVKKTDEERVQNLNWSAVPKGPWIATEKLDGSSTTFTMKRGRRKNQFYVCSRNVCFDTPDKDCYYDSNIYWEMAKRYNVEEVMNQIMNLNQFKDCEWITIQGETFGAGVQKRTYNLEGHDFRAFNFITSKDGRWNSVEAAHLVRSYGIKWVPIVNEEFMLPETVAELLEIATGKSVIDGGDREGLVFRSLDGVSSFKAVSNEFLAKYHQ